MEMAHTAKTLFRQINPRILPTEAVLCIAAVLGSVSIILAYNKAQTVPTIEKNTTATQAIVIIPSTAQKRVMLPLPGQTRP